MPITPQKITERRALLTQRTAAALGVDETEAARLLSLPRRQSIRLNPLKADLTDTLAELKKLGWKGKQYPWSNTGYSIESPFETVRDSDLVSKGAIYIQNAASWLPVHLLDPQPGEKILDMCAAPGGKSSHIAAITDNQAELWVNDNSRPRLSRTNANFARLGVKPARTSLYDARSLARKLDGQQFDKILLDAPCSGEAELDITSDTDIAGWSLAQIKRLQQQQIRLLAQAWRLLKNGGRLVYSTCTIAPEENEAVIAYALRALPDAHLEKIDIDLPNRIPTVTTSSKKTYPQELTACLRLAPSPTVEAFFVASLTKVDTGEDPDTTLLFA